MFPAICALTLGIVSCDKTPLGPSHQEIEANIIGVWQGVELIGAETYGGADACIEYKADGTYTYYVSRGDGWVPNGDAFCEYEVSGSRLTHRWRSTADADLNEESWNIESISGNQMKWTATRKNDDGSSFNTTFTWKKVEFVPSVYLAGSTSDAVYFYKDGKELYRIDCSTQAPETSQIPPMTSVHGLAVMSDGIYACGSYVDLMKGQADPIIWKDGVVLDIDYNVQTNQNGLHDMVVIGDKWICCGGFRQPDLTYRGVIFENGREVFRSDISSEFANIAYDKSSGRYYIIGSDEDGARLWCFDAITGKVISNDCIVRHDEEYNWMSMSLAVSGGKVAVGLNKRTIATGYMDYDAYCWTDGKLTDWGFGNAIYAMAFHNGTLYAGGFKGSDFYDYNGASIPESGSAVQWIDGKLEGLSAGYTGNSYVRLIKSWGDKFLFHVISHSDGFDILCNGKPMTGGEYAEGFVPSCMDVVVMTVPVGTPD